MLDNPYLEITRTRHPEPRHPDYEMKSWWCEFAFREKQRKLDSSRPKRGLASLSSWLQNILGRSRSQATHDESRSLEAAPVCYPVLDLQRPDPRTSGHLDTASLWDVACLLDPDAQVVEQEEDGQHGREATPTEAGQG